VSGASAAWSSVTRRVTKRSRVQLRTRALSGFRLAVDSHTTALSGFRLAVDSHTRALSDFRLAVDSHTTALSDFRLAVDSHATALSDFRLAVDDRTGVLCVGRLRVDDRTRPWGEVARESPSGTRASCEIAHEFIRCIFAVLRVFVGTVSRRSATEVVADETRWNEARSGARGPRLNIRENELQLGCHRTLAR
jgi:hypothetical protein